MAGAPEGPSPAPPAATDAGARPGAAADTRHGVKVAGPEEEEEEEEALLEPRSG